MFTEYHDKESACPICGHKSTRKVWRDEVGVVEEHFDCPECGYFYYMCFSKPVEGIHFDMKRIPFERQLVALRLNADKLQNLVFEVSPEVSPF